MGNTSSTQPYEKKLTILLQRTTPTDTTTIASLLSRGANPNPSISAIIANCLPTIYLLISHGAHTNTPSHDPTKHHSYPLLSHGAEVNGTYKLLIPPPVAAIRAKRLKMVEFCWGMGLMRIKNTFGLRPAKFVLAEARCRHDLRRVPRPGGEKYGERLVWVRKLGVVEEVWQ